MTFGHDVPDNDPVAARLRAALNAEADMVQPSDDSTLHTIRGRIDGERSPWWRSGLTAAAAAAVVVLLAIGAGALLFGGGDDKNPAVVAGPTGSTTQSSSPNVSDATATPTSAPPEQGEPMDVAWVYYLADDPSAGIRLYREQHPLDSGDADPVRDAVQQMLSVPPADPDYSSPWPAGTELLGLEIENDTAVVDLSDFVQVGAETEQAAVQQLVHTVTANDPDLAQVRLLVNGEAPPSGHQDWSEPVARAPQVDTLGFIWLLHPSEGSTVESPVKIVGYGTAFEGTVSWEVRKAGSDEVVAEGFTQAGSMGEFADFRDTVELPAGQYEIRAFESSAEDGRPIHVDDKTFTVGE
jgi:spore germination protein GerM